jgi:hypothetical protein
MKRLAIIALAAACGGEISNRYTNAKIGEPCVLAVEDQTTFTGLDAADVTIELPSPSADPGQLVCLANHFRGRATCPYGQDSNARPPPDAAACVTPEGQPVVGGSVSPQCTDRRAADVMTWSCRCANALGETNDGADYCSCGSNLVCAQLILPIPGDDTAGAYCIKAGTAYSPSTSCEIGCDPTLHPCP